MVEALPFEVATMVEQDITPTISTVEEARLFDEEAERRGKDVGVHVEIDTGMGRVGFWHENAVEQILQIVELRHLRVEALYETVRGLGGTAAAGRTRRAAP